MVDLKPAHGFRGERELLDASFETDRTFVIRRSVCLTSRRSQRTTCRIRALNASIRRDRAGG